MGGEMDRAQAEELSRRAGELFRSGRERIFDDVAQRRLHYHLLRLTLAGLTHEDVEDLRELGRRVFEDGDVAEQSARISRRADASALAMAIVGVVDGVAQAGNGAPREQVMLGAILGAYAVVGGSGAFSGVAREDLQTAAVLCAVGGALATSASPVVLDRIAQVGLEEYLSHQD